jgi:hypothetical protein
MPIRDYLHHIYGMVNQCDCSLSLEIEFTDVCFVYVKIPKLKGTVPFDLAVVYEADLSPLAPKRLRLRRDALATSNK